MCISLFLYFYKHRKLYITLWIIGRIDLGTPSTNTSPDFSELLKTITRDWEAKNNMEKNSGEGRNPTWVEDIDRGRVMGKDRLDWKDIVMVLCATGHEEDR